MNELLCCCWRQIPLATQSKHLFPHSLRVLIITIIIQFNHTSPYLSILPISITVQACKANWKWWVICGKDCHKTISKCLEWFRYGACYHWWFRKNGRWSRAMIWIGQRDFGCTVRVNTFILVNDQLNPLMGNYEQLVSHHLGKYEMNIWLPIIDANWFEIELLCACKYSDSCFTSTWKQFLQHADTWYISVYICFHRATVLLNVLTSR